MNPRRVYSSYIIYIYILILETWLPAIVIVFNDHERRLSIYSSRRHKRNCRYNGCPFSLFIRQQKYFSCSSPCEDRSPTIVEVNKEQCNLVFLGISRPFLPPNRGDRDVSLSRSRLPGRTGGTARAEPTVFNHPSSFFFFFQDFLSQRCVACSFDCQHRWQMFRGFSRRQRMINSKLDWIESIKRWEFVSL